MVQNIIKKIDNSAVSPVVGVMLMLVVTIIIAAVVSGFAGGIMSGTEKAPQLSMDVDLVNTGYWQSSYFKAVVTGVSEPIDTSDLKIVTSWAKKIAGKDPLEGGAEILPGKLNFKVYYKVCGWSGTDTWRSVCPQGYGPGVGLNGTEFSNFWPWEIIGSSVKSCTMDDVWSGKLGNYSWFGNYKLQAGTTMFARPFGGSFGGQSTGSSSYTVGYGVEADETQGNVGGGQYYYSYGSDTSGHGSATFEEYPESVDQMMAVFGNNWNLLRAGDTVNIKIIHTPSSKVIWQKDIVVEGF